MRLRPALRDSRRGPPVRGLGCGCGRDDRSTGGRSLPRGGTALRRRLPCHKLRLRPAGRHAAVAHGRRGADVRQPRRAGRLAAARRPRCLILHITERGRYRLGRVRR